MNEIYRLDKNIYRQENTVDIFKFPEGASNEDKYKYILDKFGVTKNKEGVFCFENDELMNEFEYDYKINIWLIARGELCDWKYFGDTE